MLDTTDTTSTTPLLDSILAATPDFGAAPATPTKPADLADRDQLDGLPPAVSAAVRAAGTRAFHLAKADGASTEDAIAAGRKAAGAKFDELVAGAQPEAPVAAPPATDPEIPTPAPSSPRSDRVSARGLARSLRDVDTLVEAGFVMADTRFERGVAVSEAGARKARKSRLEYDRMPLVAGACADLDACITGENRRMVEVAAVDVSMLDDGKVVLATDAYDITETGFASLTDRLGYRGAAYLFDACPPWLRAQNVNAQRGLIVASEALRRDTAIAASKAFSPRTMAARVRDRAPRTNDEGVVVDPGGAEVFAVVAQKYPPFDGDKVAQAFAQAMPEDARGSVRYDPATTSTRFEALFHTSVAPEDHVEGEVFRTGIRARANDSGDGSIVVRAVAFQHLCSNMSIIDKAGREIARIRHVGTVAELRQKFEAALAQAKAALAPFLRQWGYACREDVVAILKADGVALPSDPAEVMRGIFRGVLTAKRVRLPRIQGQGREKLLDMLVEAWRADLADGSSAVKLYSGITRAAVVNAFTRTAQRYIDSVNPWATDDIELDASKLLWGHGAQKPAPLTFVEEEVEVDAGSALVTA